MNRKEKMSKLVRAIDQGEPVTRKHICRTLGKKRLNPHDVYMLERLSDTGYIRVDTQTVNGNLLQYRYSLTDKGKRVSRRIAN